MTTVGTVAAQPSAHGGGKPVADDGRCLLVRVAGGDTAAFDKLFATHHGAVFAVVLSVLRDFAQSQEVAQEVFLQVWQQAARFDPARGSTGAWLKRLARRRAIDRVRSCEGAGARDTRYAADHFTVDADTVIEQVLARQEQRAVRDALGRLRPLQRESIVLAYYAGMSTAEISQQLGVNRATVKTRIRDGLIKLTADLNPPRTAALTS